MPGFIAHIGKEKIPFAPETRTKLVVDRIESPLGYQIERRVVNKFMNDRLFIDTGKYTIVLEGIVLNNHELMAQYKALTWQNCITKMYEQEGDAFFNAFRGSFSGMLYDKHQDKWLIYTNHTGEKQVFYTQTEDGLLIASEMRYMVETMRLNHLPLELNETGCYFTLTHGFCIEDHTLVQSVKKLEAGYYLRIGRDKKIEHIQYHRFSNKPKQMTQDEAVEGIDKYFRQAIKRAFEKDREYGCKHIACLSGGLDSRMTVWVAHQMGYTDQLNITFSQSSHLDFSIAQKIATDLHHDWLFKPLDGGDCIRLIDEVSPMTYGMTNFFNMSHGWSLERLIDYERYGIMHTGQVGDVVLGTFYHKMEYNPLVKVGQGAYSHEMIERLSDYQFEQDYEDEEIFCLYTRGFTGANQGLLTYQENTEQYSPFMDVDLLEFAYSIPLELRFNHKIYFDWILDKYPAAAEYIWEKTRTKIHRFENRPMRTIHILGYEVPHWSEGREFRDYVKGFILRRLGLKKKKAKQETLVIASKDKMNPLDYWYQTNPALREFMDTYWQEHKHLLPTNQLGKDMTHLYEDCVLYDKLQSLSVLAAIKLMNQ